jgi:hypothetical protein
MLDDLLAGLLAGLVAWAAVLALASHGSAA